MESEISADSPETKTESDAGIQVMNSRIQIPLSMLINIERSQKLQSIDVMSL